jgi:hypothetical protein
MWHICENGTLAVPLRLPVMNARVKSYEINVDTGIPRTLNASQTSLNIERYEKGQSFHKERCRAYLRPYERRALAAGEALSLVSGGGVRNCRFKATARLSNSCVQVI